jgi:esterase/lipase superfamily enzyme
MELLSQLANAMARLDVSQAATLTRQFELRPAEELRLSRGELLDLRIGLAEWFAEQGARDHAIRLYTDILAMLRKDDGDPLLIAEILDLLADLQMASGQSAAAAESWKASIEIALPIEGDDSEAVLWRMARRAATVSQTGDTAAAGKLRQELDRLRRQKETGFREQVRSSSAAAAALQDFELVTVHYGTHRSRTGRTSPYDYFRGKRSLPMTYGKAVVSVPKQREAGTLPTPPSWLAEERANPARYFVVKSVNVIDNRGGFFSELQAAITYSGRKEALVFIHGYNTSFARALLRTAQLSVDLEIDGTAVLYSWPSRGNVLSYLMDRNEAANPLIVELKDLIRDVALKTGAGKVHLVAHSMGGEYLLKALEELERERRPSRGWFGRGAEASSKPIFSEIVFAAPDVDATDFAGRIPRITTLGSRVTVYFSSNDLALRWSEWANGEPRAGSRASHIAGIDSVDTSSSGANLFGHEDYVTAAIDDLRAMVWLSLGPANRRALREQRGPNGVYWVHDPAALGRAGAANVRQALIWARRLGIDEALSTIGKFLKPPAANTQAAEQQEIYSAIQRELQAMMPTTIAKS